MKSYIQDLCGDEDHVVVDCAILQCMLQDAIFEKLVGAPVNKATMEEIENVIYEIIDPYLPAPPSMIIDLVLKRGDDDDGYKV